MGVEFWNLTQISRSAEWIQYGLASVCESNGVWPFEKHALFKDSFYFKGEVELLNKHVGWMKNTAWAKILL
ncbi:hypothetical protein UVI_02058780 [Ustilaginoidea virens]|uniref:Uncharacterized protein n=1 Tax=Ustilaginoidea virens TaxID=1159556 RepID=A0A1B5L5T8_USTVR|nr:hypothetical protein UVI_02058780 [Ustilaginoidea virens]